MSAVRPMIDAVFPELLQAYVIVPVPPDPTAVKPPSAAPLHDALLSRVIETVTVVAGSSMIT